MNFARYSPAKMKNNKSIREMQLFDKVTKQHQISMKL